MKKRGFTQMPFAWLFSIIVGAFILFLAIYVAIQLSSTERTTLDVKTSKDIGILLNPLEIGFESGKTTHLEMPKETRIYNSCYAQGDFGEQNLRVSQEDFGAWSETLTENTLHNKYIFSESPSEGEKFIIFSKPFNFPFKVADLTFLISEKKRYCFVNAPQEIIDEIRNLRLDKNIINKSRVGDCPDESESVCFGGVACDIRVDLNQKLISKEGDVSSYEGDALMYGAIFAERDLYECQLKRLIKRTESLCDLYTKKAVFVAQEDCNTNLNLAGLKSSLASFPDSSHLPIITRFVEEIDKANNVANCKLW